MTRGAGVLVVAVARGAAVVVRYTTGGATLVSGRVLLGAGRLVTDVDIRASRDADVVAETEIIGAVVDRRADGELELAVAAAPDEGVRPCIVTASVASPTTASDAALEAMKRPVGM